MSVHIRTEVRRIASVAGLIAAMTVGAVGVAQAQSAPSPAPAATPIGSPSGAGAQGTSPAQGGANQAAPAPARPRPASAPFNYMPSIDLIPTFTSPGIPNLLNPPQLRPYYQNWDLGGTVRFPITRQLSASFDRVTGGLIDQPLERYYIYPSNTAGYSAVSRDVVLQYRLTDVVNRFVTLETGLSFRHRLEAGGITGVPSGVSTASFPFNASSEHHFGYLAATYTMKPIPGLLHAILSFREAVDTQRIDHNVASAACTAANVGAHPLAGGGFSDPTCAAPGVLDEAPGKNNWMQTTQSATVILPVDPKHGTSFVYGGTWGALNFYEAAPVPYRYTWLNTYQINKKFNNTLSIALRHQDLHQTRQGTPLPTGVAPGLTASNVVHPESWDIIGTIHLETKSLFGH